MSAPVFLASTDALTGRAGEPGASVVLDGPEGRHAAAVRRLQPGETVLLTDGRGMLADCEVVEASRSTLTCRVLDRRSVPRPDPRLVVVQALPKGDRAELAVQMLTEVGADVIVPWAASRCVVQWRGERGAKALAKWRTHAREAAKQSRRAWVPEVADLASTEAVTARMGEAALAVVLHEEARQPLASVSVPESGGVIVVVGPEGGITDHERAVFTDAGAVEVRMGPSVLRTSTAGVAAAAALLSRTRRWS